jgi:hypothetical protein
LRSCVFGSGGGFDGDPVAEGGELGDVVTHAAFDVDAAGVVVGSEVMEAGEGAACFADSSTSTILADCATSPSTDALAAASYFDSCGRTALRHSDVLTTTSWMGLTRSRTVDCLPKQRFPSQGVVLGRVGFADALNASGPCEVSE